MDADLKETEGFLKKIEQDINLEISKIDANNITPSRIDGTKIKLERGSFPLKALGRISIGDGKSLLVTPINTSDLDDIEKALIPLGSVTRQGNMIKITFASVSEEKKKELEKIIHDIKMKYFTMVRTHRDKTIKKVKDTVTSKDMQIRQTENLDKLYKKTNETLDKIQKDALKRITS